MRFSLKRPNRLRSLVTFERRIIATITAVAIGLGIAGFYMSGGTVGSDQEFVIAVFGGCLVAVGAILVLFVRSDYLGALVEADKRANKRRAGLALIMDDTQRILVCLQAQHNDAWKGMWLPPGGYKSDTDTSTQDTAVRRARELVSGREWRSHGRIASTDNSRGYHRAVREAGSEPIHDELYFVSCDGTPLCPTPESLVTPRTMWIGAEDLDDLPTPPHFRALMEFFLSDGRKGTHGLKYWTLDRDLFDQISKTLRVHGTSNGN